MDTKKVLRIIWMWGVIFIMLNWLIASTLMHLLKIKRIDTFIQVNGRNQLLDTATLLNLSQRKGSFARYAIYYLVQFKFMVMIGFGWTILGGLIVYVLTSKPF
jgi:type IV secretory pathway component VirB8